MFASAGDLSIRQTSVLKQRPRRSGETQVDNVTPRARSKGRCAACVNLLEARTSSALRCGTCGNIGRPPDKLSPVTRGK
jgi:hypothetical protein